MITTFLRTCLFMAFILIAPVNSCCTYLFLSTVYSRNTRLFMQHPFISVRPLIHVEPFMLHTFIHVAPVYSRAPLYSNNTVYSCSFIHVAPVYSRKSLLFMQHLSIHVARFIPVTPFIHVAPVYSRLNFHDYITMITIT